MFVSHLESIFHYFFARPWEWIHGTPPCNLCRPHRHNVEPTDPSGYAFCQSKKDPTKFYCRFISTPWNLVPLSPLLCPELATAQKLATVNSSLAISRVDWTPKNGCLRKQMHSHIRILLRVHIHVHVQRTSGCRRTGFRNSITSFKFSMFGTLIR